MTQPTNYHLSSGGSPSTALLSPTHTAIETRDPMTRTEKNKAEAVSIRPGVQILSILQHLNYKPWFALAEFVDNSIQSYLANRARIEAVEGSHFQLQVDIAIEDTGTPRIVIRDNAAGIAAADYPRAFRAADVPPDQTGLSEFGMGMKSAACWFAPKWRVRSKAIGETQDGLVALDLNSIVRSGIEEVTVKRSAASANSHYTEIVLENPHRLPQRRTLGKIREYLADIYRIFLRSGLLKLTLNGEDVCFVDPEIFKGPRYDAPAGAPSVEWRKNISITLPDGVRVHGFAAIRKEGSTSRAGFALLRRDRLIQGGSDEGWKPEEIFGRSNSFRSQRVFGELFLEGVAVSHTKDGFRLEDHDHELIPLLRTALEEAPLPLLEQAEGLRVRAKPADLKKIAESAATETIGAVDATADVVLPKLSERDTAAISEQDQLPGLADSHVSSSMLLARKESRQIKFGTEDWRVVIELTTDPAVSDWLRVDESNDLLSREITIRFSLAHPFIERFASADSQELEPLVRVACAIGLAQVLARKAGVGKAGIVLMNINELMREMLAHE